LINVHALPAIPQAGCDCSHATGIGVPGQPPVDNGLASGPPEAPAQVRIAAEPRDDLPQRDFLIRIE
jgi:hypothetical protein